MEYIIHILIIVGFYALMAMSLQLLVGFTGIPHLGHAASGLLGAYGSALLSTHFGLSPWVSIWLGASIASAAGLLVVYPAIRLQGDYIALPTLGFGIVMYLLANNWVDLTRGPNGLPGIPALIEDQGLMLLWVALCVGIVYLLLSQVIRRPFGRVLMAIRDDELATAMLGKPTAVFKLKAFMLAGFVAGLAGALYAHYITFIDPSSFTVTESLTMLLMVILGGMGSLAGALMGAFLLIVVPESLRFVGIPDSIAASVRQIVYGLLLVLLVMFRPQGVLGRYRWN